MRAHAFVGDELIITVTIYHTPDHTNSCPVLSVIPDDDLLYPRNVIIIIIKPFRYKNRSRVRKTIFRVPFAFCSFLLFSPVYRTISYFRSDALLATVTTTAAVCISVLGRRKQKNNSV